MKKLMIAAAIVCAAVIAQAGAVSWKTSALYNSDGEKVKATATAFVYLLADKSAYDSLTDVWGTYGADVLAGGENASNKGGTKSQSYTSTITAKAPTDAAADTTYYAAIITTIGSGDDLKYIAEKVSATTGSDGNASPTFANAAASAAGAATAWKSVGAVPEPTSGLLLLLGVAGLALKRRRA